MLNTNKPSKLVHVPEIMPGGGDAALNQRRRVIEEVLRQWWRFAPRRMAYYMWFLAEITKVEHSSGEWKKGGGLCTLRMPNELFYTLREAFAQNLPDQPMFAADDSDLHLLYEVAPKLIPAGPRRRRK